VGFDGYGEITGGDNGTGAGGGTLPALGTDAAVHCVRLEAQFVSANDLVLLGAFTGAPSIPFPRPLRGQRIASAGGVTFTADYDATDDDQKFYFVGSVPSIGHGRPILQAAIGGFHQPAAKALS
jgi:hypothetical protein